MSHILVPNPYCEQLSSLSNLRDLREHTKFTIMIYDFVCNVCGKQFKSQKTLTQHNRDVHIEEDIPCSLCDKTFRTKKHLDNHKFSKNTEKESLQCDIKSDDTECSYNTTSVSNIWLLSSMCLPFHFFDVSSLLKKSVGECFYWMDSDFSWPLCVPVAAFGGGADNCSLTGTLLWPAHLFCNFLHRVPVSPFPPVFPVSLVSRSASSSFWSLFIMDGFPNRQMSNSPIHPHFLRIALPFARCRRYHRTSPSWWSFSSSPASAYV